MSDLFVCANQQNYARFLTCYGHSLQHIEKTHPGSEKLLHAGAIIVARSQTPGNRCHTDKTIEVTAMKWLNSKLGSGTYAAGISGITSNYDSNHRQIVTAHAKGEFVEAMWNMVDRTSSDAWRQQREISEDQVKRSVEAFQSFVNPFQLENSQPLTSLSSGAAMPEDVHHDVLNALKNDKAQKKVFMRDRLLTKTVPFLTLSKGTSSMASTAPEKSLSRLIRRRSSTRPQVGSSFRSSSNHRS